MPVRGRDGIVSTGHNVSKDISTPVPGSKGILAATPLFSIGVTTYNRPELLKQTLGSILSQTFTNFEIIVGNDYVKERLSPDLLGIRDPRIRFVNHPINLGEAQNMNRLLHMSRAPYFTWQCDDDLYASNFLEEVHAALVKFNLPPCIFTSYELVYGASFPNTPKIISGRAQPLSGREFLTMYRKGELKATGCTAVYEKGCLKRLGEIECLADSPTPLYSEHLLLVRAGLLERVAHIDAPLLRYRVHKGAWTWKTKDLPLYKQAGHNFLLESIKVFRDPSLQDDFRQNIASVLRFLVAEYFAKARTKSGYLSRHEVVPFFFSLKNQFNSLIGSTFYRDALISWRWTGVRLAWWLITRFQLK